MIFNIGIVFCKIGKGYFRFLFGLLWNILDKNEYDERSYYVIIRKEWFWIFDLDICIDNYKYICY